MVRAWGHDANERFSTHAKHEFDAAADTPRDEPQEFVARQRKALMMNNTYYESLTGSALADARATLRDDLARFGEIAADDRLAPPRGTGRSSGSSVGNHHST